MMSTANTRSSSQLELDDSLHFAARRRQIRAHLAGHPIAKQIETLVAEVIARAQPSSQTE